MKCLLYSRCFVFLIFMWSIEKQYVSEKTTHKNEIVSDLKKIAEISALKKLITWDLNNTYKEVISSFDFNNTADIIEHVFCPDWVWNTKSWATMSQHPSHDLITQITVHLLNQKIMIDADYGGGTRQAVKKIAQLYNQNRWSDPRIPEDTYSWPKFFEAAVRMLREPSKYNLASRTIVNPTIIQTRPIWRLATEDSREKVILPEITEVWWVLSSSLWIGHSFLAEWWYGDLFWDRIATVSQTVGWMNKYLYNQFVKWNKALPDQLSTFLTGKKQIILDIWVNDSVKDNSLRKKFLEIIWTINTAMSQRWFSLPIHVIGIAHVENNTRKNNRIDRTNRDLAMLSRKPGVFFHSRETVSWGLAKDWIHPKSKALAAQQVGQLVAWTLTNNHIPWNSEYLRGSLGHDLCARIDAMFADLWTKWSPWWYLLKEDFLRFANNYKSLMTSENLDRFSKLLFRENGDLDYRSNYSIVWQVSRTSWAWAAGFGEMSRYYNESAEWNSTPGWSKWLDTAYDQFVASFWYAKFHWLFDAEDTFAQGKAAMSYNLWSYSDAALIYLWGQAEKIKRYSLWHAGLPQTDTKKSTIDAYVSNGSITKKDVANAAYDYYLKHDIA